MTNNMVVQLILIVTLLVVVIWFLRLNKATKLESRFKNFAVESIHDDTIPFFDMFNSFYLKTKNALYKRLVRIKIFNEYSKKYEKYSDRSKIIREDTMDYISDKIICGIVCVLIIVVSDILRYRMITFL